MTQLSKDTFSLFKAITFVEIARQYFDLILLNPEVKRDARHFLNIGQNRLNLFVRDFNDRLGPEARETIKAHFKTDLLVFDAVFDKMADMTQEQRQAVEEFCEQIKMKKAI